MSFAGAPVQQSGSYACTRYDLRITGQGLGGVQDSFQFAFVNRDSDNESEISITARVDGINATNYPNPYAGVMIRKFGDTTRDFASQCDTISRRSSSPRTRKSCSSTAMSTAVPPRKMGRSW